MSPAKLYNALITTHHITSRKKVQKLKDSARNLRPLFVLLCSGGSPGIMYVEGEQSRVSTWVADVKRLRYKDFHLAQRPAEVPVDSNNRADVSEAFEEVAEVKQFAVEMEKRQVLRWWRVGMGYEKNG